MRQQNSDIKRAYCFANIPDIQVVGKTEGGASELSERANKRPEKDSSESSEQTREKPENGLSGSRGQKAGRPESNMRPETLVTHALDTWGATVYRLALNIMRSPHDAEDVTQDVLLRLLRDNTHFKSDEHLKAWLLRVGINRCHEVQRSAWKRRAIVRDEDAERVMDVLEDADPACNPEQQAIAALQQSPVWEAMGRLPEEWRLAVHLHHVEGCSVQEIAQLTHCNPVTVRTRLHRARKRLKSELELIDRAESEARPASSPQVVGSGPYPTLPPQEAQPGSRLTPQQATQSRQAPKPPINETWIAPSRQSTLNLPPIYLN